eukprot:TRINITY_DN15859_c0_g1_i1.p1 TRINITY_DN15859_c0_g1~~TRINITY_DN15859_c0_g1_i1.p1  ORF type:complete len:1672 (+),score=252.02 TRINITY_DN15859_c0_g1_i1:355-5016(+)
MESLAKGGSRLSGNYAESESDNAGASVAYRLRFPRPGGWKSSQFSSSASSNPSTSLNSKTPKQHEGMGTHVITRNILLEQLARVQAGIKGDEHNELWHRLVTRKIVTYLLDEEVHPTTLRCLLVLLLSALSSYPPYLAKFKSQGGLVTLQQVLPHFCADPEIYYLLIASVFGQPLLPRLPHVRLMDFYALLTLKVSGEELQLLELLDCVTAMLRAAAQKYSTTMAGGGVDPSISQTGDFTSPEMMREVSVLGQGIAGVQQQHQGSASSDGSETSGFRSVLPSGGVAKLTRTSSAVGSTGSASGSVVAGKNANLSVALVGGSAGSATLMVGLLRFFVEGLNYSFALAAACRRTEFLEALVEIYFDFVRSACSFLEQKDSAREQEHHEEQLRLKGTRAETTMPSSITVPGSSSLSRMSRQGEVDESQSQPRDGPSTAQIDPRGGESEIGQMETNGAVSEFQRTRGAAPSFSDFIDLAPNPSLKPIAVPPPSSQSSNQPPPGGADGLSAVGHPGAPVTPTHGAPVSPPTKMLSAFLGGAPADSLSGFSAALFGTETAAVATVAERTESPCAEALLAVESMGSVTGMAGEGARSTLDLIGEVLAGVALEVRGLPLVESTLEVVPLEVPEDTLVLFQGLCLGRLMKVVKRRLAKDGKWFDSSVWGHNLDKLAYLLVDKVYLGAFGQPGGPKEVLTFLISLLGMANTDKMVEKAPPVGKGTRYTALEPYVLALLRNVNRLMMYSFLTPVLEAQRKGPREGDMGESTEGGDGSRTLSGKESILSSVVIDCSLPSTEALKLFIDHSRLILCAANRDLELTTCLCYNLFQMLLDKDESVRQVAIRIWKMLLTKRGSELEEILTYRRYNGTPVDVLNSGFDLMNSHGVEEFFDWLRIEEESVHDVMFNKATPEWSEFLSTSLKLPGSKLKLLDVKRKKEMSRRSRDNLQHAHKHMELRRKKCPALDILRHAIAVELRLRRQDKYGWVLLAERKWQVCLRALVHERGLWPLLGGGVPHSLPSPLFESNPATAPVLWKLCPTEGLSRMRRRLQRCRVLINLSVQPPWVYPSEEEATIEVVVERQKKAAAAASSIAIPLQLEGGVGGSGRRNDEELERGKGLNSALSSPTSAGVAERASTGAAVGTSAGEAVAFAFPVGAFHNRPPGARVEGRSAGGDGLGLAGPSGKEEGSEGEDVGKPEGMREGKEGAEGKVGGEGRAGAAKWALLGDAYFRQFAIKRKTHAATARESAEEGDLELEDEGEDGKDGVKRSASANDVVTPGSTASTAYGAFKEGLPSPLGALRAPNTPREGEGEWDGKEGGKDEKGMEEGADKVPDSAKSGVAPEESVIDVDLTTEGLKGLEDDGEYLIRPLLEPGDKIKVKYNCERVIGLEKRDGIFLIGASCLYLIENFYLDDEGRICEKERSEEISMLDRELGVDPLATSGSKGDEDVADSVIHQWGGWEQTAAAWRDAKGTNTDAWTGGKLVPSGSKPPQHGETPRGRTLTRGQVASWYPVGAKRKARRVKGDREEEAGQGRGVRLALVGSVWPRWTTRVGSGDWTKCTRF